MKKITESKFENNLQNHFFFFFLQRTRHCTQIFTVFGPDPAYTGNYTRAGISFWRNPSSICATIGLESCTCWNCTEHSTLHVLGWDCCLFYISNLGKCQQPLIIFLLFLIRYCLISFPHYSLPRLLVIKRIQDQKKLNLSHHASSESWVTPLES